MGGFYFGGIQCGAPKIAKLVNITLISLGLMVDISIVNGIINQLITGGAPPCSKYPQDSLLYQHQWVDELFIQQTM